MANNQVLMRTQIGWVVALIISFISFDALAKCSREIIAPISPTGFTGMIKDGKVSGVAPVFFNEIGRKIGCRFTYQYVPKSRQEYLFEIGQSDVMFITNRTSKRDESGLFVPLIQIRPTIISIKTSRPPVENIHNLLADNTIKVVVVRGHNYSYEYIRLIDSLQRLDRLVMESDPESAIRMMGKNPSWVSVMSPTIFMGTVKTAPSLSNFKEVIRYEGITDFPWTYTGMYISKKSLSEQDQQYLYTHINTDFYKNKLWYALKKYFDNEDMQLGFRKIAN